MTEDEMVEWHHRLDGHEFEQALGLEGFHNPGNLNFYLSSYLSVQSTHQVYLLIIT